MASDAGEPRRGSIADRLNNEWSAPGLFFVAMGLFGLYVSRTYDVGDVNHMGPGWFPRALCMGLIVFGAIIAVQGILKSGHDRPAGGAARGFIIVLLSMILFGLTIEGTKIPFVGVSIPRLGFIPALTLCLTVAACAARDQKPVQAAITVLLVVLGSIAIFVWALGLPFRLWPGE